MDTLEPLHVDDPRRLGRYELLGRLGMGGMGCVYLGRTPEGGRAAVKVIKQELAQEADFRQRFRREVRSAVAVAGLFTARVLDADPDGDPAWLATQFVEGPSLRDALARSGPMPDDAVFRLAFGLAEALSAIHAAGVVHRDLKPGNILLAPDGPKVIDFGVSRTVDGTALTRTGHIVGTVDYMSPEQISADRPLGPATDVFSLGSVLAYAATGRTPFAADAAVAVLYRITNGEPDLGGLSAPVAALVSACLRKDPRARPTAAALAARLRATDRRRGAARVLDGGAGHLRGGRARHPFPHPRRPASARRADPTVARREFLDSTSRTLGVLDAALADLVPLRDEAPTPQVETAFSLVVDEFTAARRSFTDAHDTVEASDPLTAQAYRAGGAKVADGVRNLSFAAALTKEITLPPEYTDASAVAPQCQEQ